MVLSTAVFTQTTPYLMFWVVLCLKVMQLKTILVEVKLNFRLVWNSFCRIRFWYFSAFFALKLVADRHTHSWSSLGSLSSWKFCCCITDVCRSCSKEICHADIIQHWKLGKGINIHFLLEIPSRTRTSCLLFGVTRCRRVSKLTSKLAANPSTWIFTCQARSVCHSLYNPHPGFGNSGKRASSCSWDLLFFFSWRDVNAASGAVWFDVSSISVTSVAELNINMEHMLNQSPTH